MHIGTQRAHNVEELRGKFRGAWHRDRLLAADVVTASGEIVRASEDENPDLLWACAALAGTSGS